MAEVLLEGAISVKAVLENDSRTVLEICMDEKKRSRDFGYILNLARRKNVPVKPMPREEIDRICPDKSSGGIFARAGERRYLAPSELLCVPQPFIILLEGIEDPFNYGYAVRSAYAAGATGLLVPPRTWENAEGTVIRSSAGASEKIPTATAEDLVPFLEEAHARNVRILAADRQDAVPLYSTDLTGPLLLAIGGRLRGLSRAVYDRADQHVYIPYGNDFRNALTASGACAVMAFEALRQRMEKGQ